MGIVGIAVVDDDGGGGVPSLHAQDEALPVPLPEDPIEVGVAVNIRSLLAVMRHTSTTTLLESVVPPAFASQSAVKPETIPPVRQLRGHCEGHSLH